MSNSSNVTRALSGLAILACVGGPVVASGQSKPPAAISPLAVSSNTSLTPMHFARISEGTEVRVKLAEKLSSATSAEGDVFSVITDESISLPDGTVIPAGYVGKGEVTEVSKAGMVGKSGQLNIRLDYLKIGSQHIHLRASKGGEGKSGVTNMVVTTVLFGPLGLLVRGHSIVYQKGQPMTAYVDEDSEIPLPLDPPPRLN